MAQDSVQEGRLQFKTTLIDKPLYTYYKIIGNLNNGKTPLVILHGGPGSTHEYLVTYGKIWERYDIPVVFYDQIGCGSSTRVPEMQGVDAFWQLERFVAELENLLDHLSLRDGLGHDILGHSWGGLFAPYYACTRPRGLRRLIIASGLASGPLTTQGASRLKDQLPPDSRRAIDDAVAKGDFTGPDYAEAMGVFYRKHWSRYQPYPHPELAPALKHQAEDKTTRSSIMGPSHFARAGPLATFDTIPMLSQIQAPTLVYNGEFDSVVDEAMEPFFELIPQVRWVTLAGGSHMLHVDSPELQDKVLRLVGNFLSK